MNAPAPGWHPDPTGRHQHRYWDGSRWTDDVADAGVASTDPVDGGAPSAAATPGASGPDPTLQQGMVPPGGGAAPGGPYAGSAGPHGPAPGYPPSDSPGYPPSGYPQMGSQPPTPEGSKRSPALIVAIVVVVVALVGGGVFLLLRDDDDGDDTAAGPETVTLPDIEGLDDELPELPEMPDLDGIGGGGTPLPAEMRDFVVEEMINSSDGLLTREQAECVADIMFDEATMQDLIEDNNPFESGTTDQQAEIMSRIFECVPMDVLMELGN